MPAPSRILVEEPEVRVTITRFDFQQRAHHLLIMTSFLFLAMTGFPMKYFGWRITGWWISVWGGIDNLRTVHHFFAWVMVATCAYHLLYIVFKRPFAAGMLPNLKDLRDFVADMKHTFHLSKQPPQFGRFPYRNKGAYWIVFGGSIIMIFTGFILLYPAGSTAHLPGWLVPLALMVHSDAAFLLIGWMLLVHMYFAHFSRHTIPFDKAIVTGKVPIQRYEEEFPLEFAEILAKEGHPRSASGESLMPKKHEELVFEESAED